MVIYRVVDGSHRETLTDFETAKESARERSSLQTWSGNVRVDDGWFNLYEICLNLRPGGSGVLEVDGTEIRTYDGPVYPGAKVAGE